MPKAYPDKFKTEVIQRYQDGESIRLLSQELHSAQSTIYHWRKEYCSIKAANHAYTPKEFDALSRRLVKLEHEMEIIKRSGYIADVPLQKRLSALESIYRQPDNTYSVYELCEALEVARGTFYNYIFRRADHSKRDQKQEQLMRQVQQVFDDSAQRFGAEKIRITLAESGIRVSTKRIAAIMQELDLHSIRPDAKKQYKKQQQYNRKQNLLERQFTANHPNQIWVSDITYLKSTTTGSTFASSLIFSPARSSAIGYPATQARIWSPAPSGPLFGNAAIPAALLFTATAENSTHPPLLRNFCKSAA